jgi:hypothetical protein
VCRSVGTPSFRSFSSHWFVIRISRSSSVLETIEQLLTELYARLDFERFQLFAVSINFLRRDCTC